MSPPSALKFLVAASLLALAVSACGRRGALEPPPGAGPAPTARSGEAGTVKGARSLPDSVGLGGGRAEPEPDAVRSGDELPLAALPPLGTEAPVQTGRGAKRGYVIPKDPFILDPLL